MYLTRWVLRIIIANVLLFLLTMRSEALTELLMLVPAAIIERPWTIITYMFLHANTGHIFFNMLALFFFGPRLELELGGRNFLWLYFISGIMGGALSFFFTPHTAIVGASGAIYGVMMGFAYLWPRERIYIWGVFPVEARLLVLLMTALSLFGGFGGAEAGIAHFAHLGGFLGGFLFMKYLDKTSRSARFQAQVIAPAAPDRDHMERWAKIDRERMHAVNREEFDRISSKLKTVGISGLTPEEIAFLNRFSEQ